jgi:hypothetical protein
MFKLDQHVDVTLRGLLLTHIRAEHSNPSDASTLRERDPVGGEYRVFVGLNQRSAVRT